MSNPTDPSRILSDVQVDAITKRALELQLAGEPGSTASNLEATTLQQLMQASAEIGIPQEFLVRAASEILPLPPVHAVSTRVFRKGELIIDTTHPGQIRPEDASEMIGQIRLVTKAAGKWQFAGNEFSWFETGVGRIKLTAFGQNTHVEIVLPVYSYALAMLLGLGLGITWVMIVVAEDADPTSTVIVTSFVALVIGGVLRWAYGRASKRRLERGNQLLEAVKSRLKPV